MPLMDSGKSCCDSCNTEKVIPARIGEAIGEKPKKITWEEMEANMLKKMEADGFKRYKGRAECFGDVINAFHIIHEHNKDNVDSWGDNLIPLISPTIKGSPMGDTDFDFWTNAPLIRFQWLLDFAGRDLHRIIQTIKPFDKYDGQIDNSVWDEIKNYKNQHSIQYK